MPLPDIDEQSYNTFAGLRFEERVKARTDQLEGARNFMSRSSALIGALGTPGYAPAQVAHADSPLVIGGPGVITPPIAPPVAPPLPAPVPAPQPAPQPGPIPVPAPGPGPAPVPPITPEPTLPSGPAQPTAPTPPAPPTNLPGSSTIPEIPTIPQIPGSQPTQGVTPEPTPPTWAPVRPAAAPEPVWADTPPSATPTPPSPTGGAAVVRAQSAGPSGSIPASINVPVNQGPSISRPQAEAVVQGTALEGLGGDLWDLGVQYNVDPAFALSVAKNESNYGGTPAQLRNNNVFSISNALYGGTPVEGSRWGQYPDRRSAIEAFYKLITKEYYPNNQTTVGSVMWGPNGSQTHAYAPTSENSTEYPQRLLNTMSGYTDQPGGAPPAARTQTTVTGPQGGALSATSTTLNQSQFGDRELTAAEAEAACGPAAAIRFAQRFGRNPTLREATDLAKTVGWTAGQGMAGIQSEQQLMTKLGIDTKLVPGAQWQQFAAEAQTGNPVTISTRNHYFYADGFNPQTGAFHVGRSGLDLIGGKEWMTPGEMEGKMGAVQGALFANNPTIAASSTGTEPMKALGEQRTVFKKSLGVETPIPQQFGQPDQAQSRDPQVRQLERALELAHLPTPPAPEDEDTAAPPDRTGLATMGSGAPPPGPPGGNPFDQFGQTMANALKSLLGGGGGPPDENQRRSEELRQRQERDQALEEVAEGSGFTDEPLNLPAGALQDTGGTVANRAREMIEASRHIGGRRDLPELPIGQLGLPNLEPPKSIQEAITRGSDEALRRGLPSPGPGGQLGILDPKLANPFENPDDVISELLGLVGNRGGGVSRRTTQALDDAFTRGGGGLDDVVRRVTGGVDDGVRRAVWGPDDAGVARAVGAPPAAPPTGGGGVPTGAFAPPPAPVTRAGATAPVGRGVRGITRSGKQQRYDDMVRAYSDRQVDLNHVQDELERTYGKGAVTDDMLVGFLNRVDASHRAQVMTQRALGDTLGGLDDAAYQQLHDYVNARATVSTAEGLGKRAEREYLAGGISKRTEQFLKDAQEDLDTAQTAYGEALRTRAEVAAGTRQTRESITMDAANRRVAEAQTRLTDAVDNARTAQADQAADSVWNQRSSRLVTPAEQRELIIAEANAKRLNNQYDALYKRNPDDKHLPRLARQVARAEDRVSVMRERLGGASAEREANIASRAETAADTARSATTVSDTPELAAAKVRLRYEQRTVDRLQQAVANGDQQLVETLARAQKREIRAQADVDQATRDLPAAARAQGFAQTVGREFPGGLGFDEARQQLDDTRASLSPEEMDALQRRGDAVFQYARDLRQRAVDDGLMSPEFAAELEELYPDWLPTRILDYMMDDSARGMKAGARLSVSDRNLHAYTAEGTTRAAQDRIHSLVNYAQQQAALGAKNKTVNALIKAQGNQAEGLIQIAPDVKTYEAASKTATPMLPPSFTPTNKQKVITGWVNGEKQRWMTENPYLHEAIESEPSGLSGALGTVLSLPATATRVVTTQRNPGWLLWNTASDAYNLMATTMAKSGGRPDHAALTAYEYLRALPDAFAGLLSGRYEGQGTQDLLLGGGGMRGGAWFGSQVEGGQKIVDALRRTNGFQLKSKADLKRWADKGAFGWVESVGNRLELAPRVAAMRMAKRRGESDLRAVMAARDVTTDFDRGGNFIRQANRIIPFLNAQAQGGANLVRLAKENKKGFIAAGITLVGAPTMAIEAHNRSTPEMSKAYDDVPQFIKNQGMVIMLDHRTSTDRQGNRLPNYFVVPVRGPFSPFMVAGREAFDRLTHRDSDPLPQQLLGVAGSQSPLGSVSNPMDLAMSLAPMPASTIAQLYANRDAFRDSAIATERSDENASALSRLLAPALQRGRQTIGGQEAERVRPSQVDFFIRDTLGGPGQSVLAGSDLIERALTGKTARSNSPAEIPIAGSAAGRFVRTTGGQLMEDATQKDAMMDPSIRRRLQALGDYYEPSTVPANIGKVPLKRDEQLAYQQKTNEYFNHYLEIVLRAPSTEKSEAVRQHAIRTAMTTARERASAEVLRDLPKGEVTRRYKSGSTAS